MIYTSYTPHCRIQLQCPIFITILYILRCRRNDTTRWRQCTTAVLKPPSWSTTSPTPTPLHGPRTGSKSCKDRYSYLICKVDLLAINRVRYISIFKARPDIVIALAGNKSDLGQKRVVEYEEAAAYAEENGLLFMETSAKNANNVNEIFLAIARKLPRDQVSFPLQCHKHRVAWTTSAERFRRRICHQKLIFQDGGNTQPGGIRPGQSGENEGGNGGKLSTCCK